MLKFFIILIPLILFEAKDVSAQNIPSKYPDLIKRIKTINNDSTFEKVILVNEQFMPQMTDGGGELIGYFKEGQVQKITRSIGLSYGIETFEYYFLKGKLIFIYETRHGFIPNDSLGTLDHTKTELNFIGRYYFKNDKLIDNETTGHNRFERDDIDMEKVLLAETKENLSSLIRSQKK